jgi:hypothetical protein
LIFVAAEPLGTNCYTVSANPTGRGFSDIDMNRLTASYDPAKGLLLSVPVSAFDGDKGGSVPIGSVKVRISRAKGSSVTIEK